MAQANEEEQHVLILGAYGLVGFGIATQLSMQGIKVTGFGRSTETAHRVLPRVTWITDDLRSYSQSENWHEALGGITTVINCSGALQDGPEDDLEIIHHHMVAALATACAERDILLIQISAVGASIDASTEFLSSKARGDAAIRVSGGRYNIFRPGLILAPHAYGGTALLRMLTAIPVVQPVAYPDARIQTVSLSDVSGAVMLAVIGEVPDRFECDLVEPQAHSLRDVLTALRKWLGFGRARFYLTVSEPMAMVVAKGADALSWLGWRSPLRSTGLRVLRDGVTGDPSRWDALNLPKMSSINQTLEKMHATSEDRLAARMALLMPVMIVTLAAFWFLSGLIGLVRLDLAAGVLTDVGWSRPMAMLSVVFWSIIDFVLAGAILVRKLAILACWAMIGTSVFYLAASSVFVPHLWLDPLGPLVKAVPATLLALVARVSLESR